jgi:polysaccharide export outer membrane protein
MLQASKLFKSITISISVLALSACAFAPGMRVGDLPPVGKVVLTEKGLNVQVEPITAETISNNKYNQSLEDLMPLFAEKSYPQYDLASGDVLNINLWANPEITPPSSIAGSGFVIDQQGYIAFPLIGRIKAAGETVESFSNQLTKRLALYLKQPDAQVKVLTYAGRKIFVDGSVRLPGQFVMSDQPQTLNTALSQAGGVSDLGDLDNIVLTRGRESYHLGLLSLEQNHLSANQIFLKQNDSIHVYAKENRKIYLLGEAGIPNSLLIPEQGISLASVIGEGKGINPLSADPSKVYVVRDDSVHNLLTIYHLDMSSLANFALANRFKMQPNDMVYVDASGLARWNRVLSLLLPAVQGVGTAGVAKYYVNQ